MRKALAFVLMIAMVFAVVACEKKAEEPKSAATSSETTLAVASAPDAQQNNGGYDLTGCKALTITLPLPNGTTAVDTVFTEKWMKLIAERSNGLIAFDYTNSGALGNAMELMEGVDMGAYDMSVIDLANFDAYVPQVDVLCLPYIIKDWDNAEEVYLGEPNQWLVDMIAQKMDITVLGNIGMGFRSVISKDPLRSLADCKGYLIRTPDLELYIAALGTLGFKCTSLSFGETYSGMQSGVIDGMETTLNVLYGNGYYDVGKYILQTRHFFACSEAIVNTTFWNKLPEVYRRIISDSFKEIEKEAWQYARSTEESLVSKFEEKGVTIYEFSDEDRARVIELFLDYWNQKASKMGDGATEMLHTLINMQK